MPQIVFLAMIGAGLYIGYRWVARVAKEAAAELERAQAELRRRAGAREKDLGQLVWDPASGVYRPGKPH
jgi:hypothetical protein